LVGNLRALKDLNLGDTPGLSALPEEVQQLSSTRGGNCTIRIFASTWDVLMEIPVLMLWPFSPPMNAWLQLLELLILAILGFCATMVFPNYFLTLQRKARVLKIRALRALDSAMDSCPRHADCAASRVTTLPKLWALVAEHSGLVGAWRLTGVCTAAREGAKEWLRTLPEGAGAGAGAAFAAPAP
jgi:hypothetical protein